MEVGKKYKGVHSGEIYTCVAITSKGTPIVEDRNGVEHLVVNPQFYKEYKEPKKIGYYLHVIDYGGNSGIVFYPSKEPTINTFGKLLYSQKVTWEEGKGFTLV